MYMKQRPFVCFIFHLTDKLNQDSRVEKPWTPEDY